MVTSILPRAMFHHSQRICLGRRRSGDSLVESCFAQMIEFDRRLCREGREKMSLAERGSNWWVHLDTATVVASAVGEGEERCRLQRRSPRQAKPVGASPRLWRGSSQRATKAGGESLFLLT